MKITYSVAASIDGFIARENDDVSWLDDLNLDPNEIGFEQFLGGIDGLVMGRKTYDFVFEYGTWPYGDKVSWVCTHRDLDVLAGANLKVVANVEDVLNQALQEGVQHLWLVGGGRLASSFLAQGLITHIVIAEMPIRLGSGIPLFSTHRWQDIAIQDQEITEKMGFRQIELVLAAPQ